MSAPTGFGTEGLRGPLGHCPGLRLAHPAGRGQLGRGEVLLRQGLAPLPGRD